MCLKMLKCDLLIYTLCVFFLVIIPCSNSNTLYSDYDYDYDDEIYSAWDSSNLSMITIPRVFRIHLGESVTLPCETSNNELISERRWSHDQVEIVSGAQMKNKEFVNSNDLKINVTSYSDAGVYICKVKFILTELTVSVDHTVDILPKNVDDYRTTTESATVKETTVRNVIDNTNQIYEYSTHMPHTITTEKLPLDYHEVHTHENTPRNSFLMTLAEAIQSNSLGSMLRQRLANTKSSASSPDNYFRNAYSGVYLLTSFAIGLNLL